MLLTRIFMDMQYAAARWDPPTEFLQALLPNTDEADLAEMTNELDELLAYESLVATDDRTLEMCGRWDQLCSRIFHSFQDEGVAEVQAAVA